LTRFYIFFVGNDKYVLNDDEKTVVQQPANSKLTYEQALQFQIDNKPTPIPTRKLTREQINAEIVDRYIKENNIEEI
jgi:hypothetical protein